jgi:hypothetical protein
MTQPWQLQRAKRRGNRPLIEELSALDCRTLARKRLFPGNWIDQAHYQDFGLVLPAIHSLILSRHQAEIVHRHGSQIVPLRWLPISGLSKKSQRPVFLCSCGRRAFRLFLNRGRFTCKRCCGAIYASQAIHSANRPGLQAERLRRFLGGWAGITPSRPSGMHGKTYSRLIGQLTNESFHSRRLTDVLPVIAYRTRKVEALRMG